MNNTAKKEALNVLSRSTIFSGLNTQKLEEQFLPAMELVYFRKQTDNQKFHTNSYFYVVASGMVHGFLRDSRRDRRVSLFVFREGDGFDVLNLLGGYEDRISFACLQREQMPGSSSSADENMG